MHHGPVERGGGRGGDVHGVHGTVRVAPAARPPRTALAPGQRLLLGAVGVVPVGPGRTSAGTRGERLAPLFVVALVVLAGELLLRVALDEAEPLPEQSQPLRDRVDGRRRDDQQTEDREQDQERYGEDVAHGVGQRGGRAPADEAAGVPYRLHAVAARGRPAGDVDLPEHADDERGQTDHDAPVGLGLLGVPDEADRDGGEEYRHEQVEPAEGAGHQHLDEVTDGSAQVRPGARRDDQRETEQQKRDAVLAMRRVEPLRAPPYAAEHRSDGMRETEPHGAYEPVHARGRAGRRRGYGLLRRGLLGDRLLGDRLFAGAFFTGAFVGAAAFFAGGFLAAD